MNKNYSGASSHMLMAGIRKGNPLLNTFSKVKLLITLVVTLNTTIIAGQGARYFHFYVPHSNGATFGLKDEKGNVIVPAKYRSVDSTFYNGLSMVTVTSPRGGWESFFGFVNNKGEEVIAPRKYKYTSAQLFKEGLAAVERDGKYGFIDNTGKVVVPLIYDNIIGPGVSTEGFSEGMARVKLNGRYGFIDKTGKQIIAPQYDYAYAFSHGVAMVGLNKKYGVVNKAGKIIVPIEYDDCKILKSGGIVMKTNYVKSILDTSGLDKWYFFDTLGKIKNCSSPDLMRLADTRYGFSFCLDRKYLLKPRYYNKDIQKDCYVVETAPELSNRGMLIVMPVAAYDTAEHCQALERRVLNTNNLSRQAVFDKSYVEPADENGLVLVTRTYVVKKDDKEYLFSFTYFMKGNEIFDRLCFYYFGEPMYQLANSMAVKAISYSYTAF